MTGLCVCTSLLKGQHCRLHLKTFLSSTRGLATESLSQTKKDGTTCFSEFSRSFLHPPVRVTEGEVRYSIEINAVGCSDDDDEWEPVDDYELTRTPTLQPSSRWSSSLPSLRPTPLSSSWWTKRSVKTTAQRFRCRRPSGSGSIRGAFSHTCRRAE